MKSSQNKILKANRSMFSTHLMKAENYILMANAELRLMRKTLYSQHPSNAFYSTANSDAMNDRRTGIHNNFIKSRRGLNK